MEGSRRLYRGWQRIVIKGQWRLVKPHVGAYSISSCHIHSGDIPHQTAPHGSHQPITGLRPGDFPGLTINQWEALRCSRNGNYWRTMRAWTEPNVGAKTRSLGEELVWDRSAVRRREGERSGVGKQQGSHGLYRCGKASDRKKTALRHYWRDIDLEDQSLATTLKREYWVYPGIICYLLVNNEFFTLTATIFLVEDKLCLFISHYV